MLGEQEGVGRKMVVTCSSTFVYCLLLQNAHAQYPILVQIFAKTREQVTAKRLQEGRWPYCGLSLEYEKTKVLLMWQHFSYISYQVVPT